MIDWDLARRTAARLTKPGPDASPAQIAEAVAELRAGAARSEGPVREFTGLAATSASAPVLVVDRPRWAEANVESFRVVMDPLLRKLAAAQRSTGPLAPVTRAVGRRVSGVEMGALLSFLAPKVLGQFDPFWSGTGDDGRPLDGRLLLVAPNVMTVERQLGVDPHDFRLWVCLHEETHRVQFTAVPWMRAHLTSLVGELVDATETDPAALSRVLGDSLGEVARIVRGESDASLSDLFQNERQGEVVDRITGLMSLLEGHADVVMDGVGPEVIPTVAKIRRAFDQRRRSSTGLDALLRRLLGLDAKMRQYRDGATFVREVERTVGREGFDAVWAAPENLPGKSEITDPAAWVARVHG